MNVKVVRGGVTTNSLNYTITATSTAFAVGDLIRITAAGTVELADPAASGSIHGIALGNSLDYSAGDRIPVALFNSETILAVPTEAGNAPEDYTVGGTYGLVVTTKAQTLDLSETSGQLIVTGKVSDDQSFDPDVDDTEDGTQYVYCRVSQANLDARIAATVA